MASRNYRWANPEAFDALARKLDVMGEQHDSFFRQLNAAAEQAGKREGMPHFSILFDSAAEIVKLAGELEASAWMEPGDPKPWQRQTVLQELDRRLMPERENERAMVVLMDLAYGAVDVLKDIRDNIAETATAVRDLRADIATLLEAGQKKDKETW